MRLLISIPVFNERKYVEHVLAKVLAIHSDVLLIDDGSSDGTGEYLAGRDDIQLIRHPRNMGYGQSLIDAFDYADRCGYDWVITMDCDEQHEPERIPEFVRELETDQWDIVSGSRYLLPIDSKHMPPVDRRTINSTITGMLNETFDWKLTDSFCGFKAHRVSAMRQLHLSESGYAFPMQLWPQVYRAGLRVTEIPVSLIYNDPTRTFGGVLDDAQRRLRHYLDVFNDEVTNPRMDENAVSDPAGCCCG